MYQLLIKDPNGVWQTADLGEDAPAFNFEMNDIAELQDRQANYSQSLSLPITPNNCRIFGYINSPQVVTDVPYRLHECRLLFNGIPLAGKGSVLKILSITSDTISVQVLSGMVDIFEQLKNLDFEAKVNNQADDILGITNRTYQTPIFDTILVGNGHKMNEEENGLHPYIVQDIGLSIALSRTIQKVGYSLGDTGVPLNGLYLLPAKRDVWRENESSVVYGQNFNTTHSLGISKGCKWPMSYMVDEKKGTVYVDCKISVNKNIIPTIEGYPLKLGRQGYNLYIAYGNSNNVDYNIIRDNTTIMDFFDNCEIDNPNIVSYETRWRESPDGYNWYKRLRLYNNGDVIEVDWDGNELDKIGTYQVFNPNKGNDLYFYWKIDDVQQNYIDPSNPSEYNFYCEVYYHISTGLPAQDGQLVSITNNLGLKSGDELLKLYMQLTGTICVVNHKDKTINFYSLSELYTNKANAKDWSSKLVRDSESRSFVLSNYAKKNIILAKENKVSEWQQTLAEIVCNNDTIEREKTLFTANILSAKNDTIEYYQSKGPDDNGNEVFEPKDLAAPALIKLDRTSHARTIESQFYTELYEPISRILQKKQAIEAEFNLTMQDIADFDHFIPVYLQQYGAYFYVNKITDFIVGQPTKVELIKI